MLRFKLTAAAYALMLLFTYVAYMAPSDAAMALPCLLILSCVVLFPRTVEDEELHQRGRKGWADRVEINAPPADKA